MILLLGKNGSGKTYISNHLNDLGYKKSISFSTREKRPMEVEGIDYYFVKRDVFEKMIANGEFLEYKEFNGNYYGTHKDSLKEASIFLSGGNISPEIVPYLDDMFFINTPLEIRYNGMLKRKFDIHTMFYRIHGENFEYLFDYPTKTFYNDHSTDIVLEVLDVLDNPEKKNRELFKKIIMDEINKYDPRVFKKNQLLSFLLYEEYLLRVLYLEDNLNKDYYKEKISSFLKDGGFCYEELDEHYNIRFGNKTIKSKILVPKK